MGWLRDKNWIKIIMSIPRYWICKNCQAKNSEFRATCLSCGYAKEWRIYARISSSNNTKLTNFWNYLLSQKE